MLRSLLAVAGLTILGSGLGVLRTADATSGSLTLAPQAPTEDAVGPAQLITPCGRANSCALRPTVTPTITTFSIGGSGPGTWDVIVSGVPAAPNPGVLIYGVPSIVPPIPTPYGGLCISPLFRVISSFSLPFPTTGGCAPPLASYRFDFGSHIQAASGTLGILPGNMIGLQAWYRDPPNPGGANLTDVIGPFGPLVP